MCARHQPARIERFAAVVGFQLGLDDRTKRERRDAELQALLGDRQQLVDRHPLHAGHGSHFLRAGFSVQHEDRIDEIPRDECGLAHQAARELVAPHAPHPHCREAAVNLHLFRNVIGGNFARGSESYLRTS